MTELEFWPDYGPGPLWDRGGPVDLATLEIDGLLAERLAAWNAAYEEHKVPLDGEGDAAWLIEGAELLAEIRAALGNQYRVVVTEPWWGEAPN